MTNKFGNLFSFTSWGESHGEAIGCVIDGCPSLIDLEASDIQKYLDKRRPGQSKFTTQRQEKDEVKILSGVFEGKTTGTPISLIIYNQDQKSSDYNEIKDKFRPSHGDYAYWQKYGIRDYRGGGRSSARETAMRVAAGAIARKIIAKENIQITGYLTEIGGIKIDPKKIDFSEINNNDFFCPDLKTVALWQENLLNLRKNGDSAGAIIEVVAKNVPAGLGEPIYNKLDAAIASAMMGINAVKAVEIGLGFEITKKNGSQVADEMIFENDKVKFLANYSGGTTAGISTGQDIVVRFAVKPTSSILTAKKTIDLENNNTKIATKGRHDPCVGIRAVPVGEAMLACVLADFLLLNKSRK
jgi:chorismate synthase